VSEYSLKASPFLGGYDRCHGALRLREITDLTILSAALPLGEEAAGLKALSEAFSAGIPQIGQSTLAPDGKTRLARLGQNQFFAFANGTGVECVPQVYWTDQSDVWVTLELSGAGVLGILERLCPIDLAEEYFPINAIARTVMRHLPMVIVRVRADRFLLLSASSSAVSFLQTLEGVI